MADDYPKEELQKIYEVLPKELKEAVFSEKVADDIYDVCVENGLEDKNTELAKYVGYVLLGLLSPRDFEKTLKEKMVLNDEAAKKVGQEITRLVFSPLKKNLEALYKIKIEVIEPPKEPLKEETTLEQTSRKQHGKDTYREPIE
jgi:hypothetical protein